MPSVRPLRQAERAPRGDRVARHEAGEVDAGRDRGHALERNAVVARELAAQRLAGGDDVRGRVHVEPARADAVADGRRHVARAHDRRRVAQRRAGERAEPAVGRAVRVEHVDAPRLAREPAAQREERRQPLLPDRQRHDRDAHARPRRGDRRFGGAISVTRWPRSSMPRASVRMRISWPPQPQEFSVCTIDSGCPSQARSPARSARTSARGSGAPTAASRGSCGPTRARPMQRAIASGRISPRRASPVGPERRLRCRASARSRASARAAS